jgi:opacity protein-like surface antigen
LQKINQFIKLRIMKKMLLTAAIAFTSLIASAQFMVTADLDMEDFDTENITETTNFGFGYTLNDSWTVGAMIMAEGVHEDETEAEHADHEDEDFRLFVRYNWNESIYLTANTSTEEFSDNLRIGAGYSFAAFGNFYLEPNYTMDVTADDADERNGKFKLGLAYRF